VASFDAARTVAVLEDGTELPCDLFLGVPSRAPEVVLASGMAEGGYIPVDRERSRPAFQASTRSETSQR
jgi:sulfide:quinone oxidoreductase